LGVLAAVVFALGIRIVGLDAQILTDDEFHAFRAALRGDLDALYLFTQNTLPEDPASDFSSPLALWARGLAQTVGISEVSLRAPMVAASVALVAVVGRVGARTLGPHAGVVVAWLAALSPLLFTYGRFARPYALVALCGALALSSAERFRRNGDASAAAILGVTVALGSWFNVSALPGLGLLGLLGFAPALRGRQGDAARRAAAAGLALAACLALGLLGPSADALARFAEMKSGAEEAPLVAWWGAAQAFAGTQAAVGVFGFGLFVIGGAAWGMRRAPSITGLALATFAAQLGAFIMLRPYGSDEPLVIARYAIVAYPGVLLLAAAGLAGIAERVPSPAAAAALSTGLVLGGVSLGPLPALLRGETAFANHPATLVTQSFDHDAGAGSSFYATLPEDPPLVLVEVPWVLEWPLAIPAHYQAAHGHVVRALTAFWTFREPGVVLRAHVPWLGNVPQLEGVSAVIVHTDLVGEWAALTGAPVVMPEARLEEAAARYQADARAIDRWLVRQPDWKRDYEDQWVRVYVPRTED
jgi:hypothetical protein